MAEDWTQNETHRQLLALAEERKLATEAAAEPAGPTPAATAPVAQAVGAQPAPVAQPEPAPAPDRGRAETGLVRGGFIAGVPQALVTQAFQIETPGATEVVDAENRVFLVTLDQIHPADVSGEDAGQMRDAIAARMADSLRQDVFDYYSRALQARAGATVNQTAVDAVNAQAQ